MSAIAFRYLGRATGLFSLVLMTATIVLLPGVHVATAVASATSTALTHGAPVAVFPNR